MAPIRPPPEAAAAAEAGAAAADPRASSTSTVVVDLPTLSHIYQHLLIWNCFVVFQMGVWTWEYLTTINMDWRLITGKEKLKTSGVCFIIARLALNGLFIGQIFLIQNKNHLSCQALWYCLVILGSVAVSASNAIYCLRAMAVWDRRLWVVLAVCCAWLVQASIWFLNVIGVQTSGQDISVIGFACSSIEAARFSAAPFITTIIVDLTASTLIVTKLWKNSQTSSSQRTLRQLILRDAVLYSLAAIGPNIAAPILFWVVKDVILRELMVSFAIAVHVLLASRAFIFLHTAGRLFPSRSREAMRNGQRLDRDSLDRLYMRFGAWYGMGGPWSLGNWPDPPNKAAQQQVDRLYVRYPYPEQRDALIRRANSQSLQLSRGPTATTTLTETPDSNPIQLGKAVKASLDKGSSSGALEVPSTARSNGSQAGRGAGAERPIVRPLAIPAVASPSPRSPQAVVGPSTSNNRVIVSRGYASSEVERETSQPDMMLAASEALHTGSSRIGAKSPRPGVCRSYSTNALSNEYRMSATTFGRGGLEHPYASSPTLGPATPPRPSFNSVRSMPLPTIKPLPALPYRGVGIPGAATPYPPPRIASPSPSLEVLPSNSRPVTNSTVDDAGDSDEYGGSLGLDIDSLEEAIDEVIEEASVGLAMTTNDNEFTTVAGATAVTGAGRSGSTTPRARQGRMQGLAMTPVRAAATLPDTAASRATAVSRGAASLDLDRRTQQQQQRRVVIDDSGGGGGGGSNAGPSASTSEARRGSSLDLRRRGVVSPRNQDVEREDWYHWPIRKIGP